MPPAILRQDANTNVVLAFDCAKVRIDEMPKLRAYLPALEQFFENVAAADEDPDEEPVIFTESNMPDS